MTIKTGQQATTASAVDLPSVAFASGLVTLKAPKGNAAAIDIGGAGVTLGNGFTLDPGDSVTVNVLNLSFLYVVGANTTDKITWIGQ